MALSGVVPSRLSMPKTPLKGVRSSWLILARKRLLPRLAVSACNWVSRKYVVIWSDFSCANVRCRFCNSKVPAVSNSSTISATKHNTETMKMSLAGLCRRAYSEAACCRYTSRATAMHRLASTAAKMVLRVRRLTRGAAACPSRTAGATGSLSVAIASVCPCTCHCSPPFKDRCAAEN